MFTQDRTKIRQFFFDAWKKQGAKEALEPMEQIVVDIIRLHPEYHALFEAGEDELDRDYTPEMGESNPFLHLGMHIAIHEQLTTNRPTGIRDSYQKIAAKLQDPHEAEHKIMECLGEMMWQAQRDGSTPDEKIYLTCINRQV